MNKNVGMPPHLATDKQIEMLLAGAERDIDRGSPLESQFVAAALLASMCHEIKARRAESQSNEVQS